MPAEMKCTTKLVAPTANTCESASADGEHPRVREREAGDVAEARVFPGVVRGREVGEDKERGDSPPRGGARRPRPTDPLGRRWGGRRRHVDVGLSGVLESVGWVYRPGVRRVGLSSGCETAGLAGLH